MDLSFHAVLRTVHILAGALGLVCFWIPIFAQKGGKVHLVAGRVFVRLAQVIVVSATISCIWALVAPVQFSGITRNLSPEEVTTLSATIRFFFGILGLLTTWFVASLQVGLRAVRTKKNLTQLGDMQTRVVVAVALFASLAAVVFGTCEYVLTDEMRYVAFVALGLFGVADGLKTLRLFSKQDHGKMDWWYLHMDNMLGLGIAFHTAFFVFGGSRIWGELTGIWAIAPWALPAIIGVTASQVWTKYYRRKFGEQPASSRKLAKVM